MCFFWKHFGLYFGHNFNLLLLFIFWQRSFCCFSSYRGLSMSVGISYTMWDGTVGLCTLSAEAIS